MTVSFKHSIEKTFSLQDVFLFSHLLRYEFTPAGSVMFCEHVCYKETRIHFPNSVALEVLKTGKSQTGMGELKLSNNYGQRNRQQKVAGFSKTTWN